MNVYVDTSVLLRVLLNEPNRIQVWGNWEQAFVCTLVQTEFCRTLDRLRLEGKLNDKERMGLRRDFDLFWSTCYRLPLTDGLLRRASEPYPTVVGTLDAIHLAAARLVESHLGTELILLTHDVQLARTAVASGMKVLPEPE